MRVSEIRVKQIRVNQGLGVPIQKQDVGRRIRNLETSRNIVFLTENILLLYERPFKSGCLHF